MHFCVLVVSGFYLYNLANPCTATQVANSDKSGTDAITGVTGDAVTVTCNAGYSGSGDATCQALGTFSTITCTGIRFDNVLI